MQINSIDEARRHGAYWMERNLPVSITAGGSGASGVAARFPWGPEGAYLPSSGQDYLDKYAPDGADRDASTGCMALLGVQFPELWISRVCAAAAARATSALGGAGTLTAKYKGALGNAIVATVAAATNGVATSFNLALTLTGTTGETVEIYENIPTAPAYVAPDLSASKLVGSLAITSRPTNANYTLAGGSDGVVAASDYIGTPETGDRGIAAFEGHDNIRNVFVDDCGSGLRAAVNAGLLAHERLMGNRVAYMNADSGQTAQQARTAASSLRDVAGVFVDVWPKIRNAASTLTLVPPAVFAASVAAQSPASRSIAWKSDVVQRMLGSIVELEANRGLQAATNTDAGVITLIQETSGGFTFESAVTTIAPVTPSKKKLNRTRVGIFIGTAFVASMRSTIDAPNVPALQDDILVGLESFMAGLKRAAATDYLNETYVLDYRILPKGDFNTPETLAQDLFIVPLDVKVGSDMSRIVLSFRYGETLTFEGVQ